MKSANKSCRRCTNTDKAIACADSIEQRLASDPITFKSFFASVNEVEIVSLDIVATAISQMSILPPLVSQTYLVRSTKRNVYPTVFMNTARLLCGTFLWNISQTPTSLDLAFNSKPTSSRDSVEDIHCRCQSPFFGLHPASRCTTCGKPSLFQSTTSRIHGFQKSYLAPIPSLSSSSSVPIIAKRRTARRQRFTNDIDRVISLNKSCNLQSITNNPESSLIIDAVRPNATELASINQVNVMLSNFVITYFFTILARSHNTIVYREFLFDLVLRDGGWKQFVTSSNAEGHYTSLFAALRHKNSVCIIPICHNSHWTILIRKFVKNSWTIFFIDSIEHGSDQRFSSWKNLFYDDDLFAGQWNKVKVIQQVELECGARACLHGLCFALSNKNSANIMNNIKRISNLAVRSRSMVSSICNNGRWSPQGWLKSIIDV